jgi:serine/threonine-protein kinase
MGIVYQAEDDILQRQVAYKVLPNAVRDDPRALEDFLREARIAAALHHPNIVTIFDAGQTADAVYIAMEYVEGRSLQDILDEVRVLPLPRALDVFRQACRSLIHAHQQQIVHRDVKPANIMVSSTGAVKLMDFGLAAVVSHAGAKVSAVRGTPYYMAPEQIAGDPVSALADQYALGCTLYHMVSGRPPFIDGDVLYHHIHTEPVSPRNGNPKIPVWLDAIILRTMIKAPAKRFPSVEVLLHEVEQNLAGPEATQVLGDAPR